jgi:hypothetical protein
MELGNIICAGGFEKSRRRRTDLVCDVRITLRVEDTEILMTLLNALYAGFSTIFRTRICSKFVCSVDSL